jgi:hypothetical protein
VQQGKVDHYYIQYELKDKDEIVDTRWILEILIDNDSIQLYINNTYMAEQADHYEYLQSLR